MPKCDFNYGSNVTCKTSQYDFTVTNLGLVLVSQRFRQI